MLVEYTFDNSFQVKDPFHLWTLIQDNNHGVLEPKWNADVWGEFISMIDLCCGRCLRSELILSLEPVGLRILIYSSIYIFNALDSPELKTIAIAHWQRLRIMEKRSWRKGKILGLTSVCTGMRGCRVLARPCKGSKHEPQKAMFCAKIMYKGNK